MATLSALKLNELKRELGPKLIAPERVEPPPGVASGWPQLDRFLLWKGFPKGALTLMVSEGGGATTLWNRSAAAVTKNGQWCAWVNEPAAELTPWSLRREGVDLSKLLYVSPPTDERQLLWVLQELVSLSLFEMIGCDLGHWDLKEHQILKLKRMALRYQTAIVFIARAPPRRLSSFYSLILHFQKAQVCVARALHRLTPHRLERKDLYADTLPLLATGFKPLAV